ncbi:MAG: homogentisate 1,2-dioxygenase [Chloroflexi bacterium]|nr:homogentisate 1,2-dioxygenase [Ardenticatenaceae bacterium]MBL1127243.1 homogentisate 1,2-dioxygenase [Chloroflexota bacterium]NOG33305.1 homogentisate 1,2-dioxygenase [Chloroflexota bacterium]GIK56127.1 MAG: homogentisate 1,2-dioxygenase [Chloroflexota bacterium]
MTYYYKLGEVPQKRHVQFRQGDGSLYHEEVMGIHGFAGIQSILYHIYPPTAVRRIEAGISTCIEYVDGHPLKHRHLKSALLPEGGDAVDGRVPLMGNNDVVLYVARPNKAMDYWYKFAHGDDVLFIHDGTGVLESQFGLLPYRPGDYLVIPTGVIWRLLPDAGVEQRMLVVESYGHVTPPKRYINNYGQFLEHSPYCERDIRTPERLVTHNEKGEFEIRVKARNLITRFIYDHHPLDVVGWDGHLWPFAFNIEDFEPITGRIHQPPPVHQTFDGPGYVLCSFVPRLFDYHPQAIPAPYNHSNVDSDEVLYYVEGNFMSRKGIERASLTIHPNGIPHGPHPGTYEGSIGKKETHELAVMVDTFAPLKLTKQALEMEDAHYAYSWLED